MISRADRSLALALAALAAEAGQLILQIAAAGAASRTKADGSPVTAADERAEALLVAALARLLPGVPVLAEEQACAGMLPASHDEMLVIDPLDGTKEFIAGRPEFTVNIAVVAGGTPVVGTVHAPALGRTWAGASGAGAWSAAHEPGAVPAATAFSPVATRVPMQPPVAMISHSHLDPDSAAFLDRLGVRERRPMGSSIKFTLIASGEADVYPRFGPVMEWDIAAGHAVLAAAGGAVLSPDGTPVSYGHAERGYRCRPFIAWGRPPV
jgi:3'(2'), 5'-bisphosphate nucleotidase